DGAALVTGRLYIYVGFDWGDEVDLDRARQLAPGEIVALPRRPRTPTSIGYKPSPLRFRLAPGPLDLPGVARARIEAAEATVFDFAAVSVSLQVPFRLSPAELTVLAGRLADAGSVLALVQAVRRALEPLHEKILPAVQKPDWHDNLWEEYFV